MRSQEVGDAVHGQYVYHRGKDPKRPGDVVLFADDQERIDQYGDDLYVMHTNNLAPVPEWVADWAEEHYRAEYGDEYDDYVPAEVDPEDIVTSAGVWDDEQFVFDFWTENEDKLLDMRDKGVFGFRTQDGAVVFPGADTPSRKVRRQSRKHESRP